jgi:hypothetical protein
MDGHPLKPKLALAVGVIGHRPDRLPQTARDKVESDVATVLKIVSEGVQAAHARYQDVFSPAEPLLSCVSGLAEGADRIVAKAALARGWLLDAVLPFSVSTYAADFHTEQSRAEFDELCGKARATLALPGRRENETHAYRTVGLTILDQCDLLLAVWDRGPSGGPGGTTDMVETATQLDVPIIHVDANGQQPPRVYWSQLGEFPALADNLDDLPNADAQRGFTSLIERLVGPPKAETEQFALKRYFAESFFRFNFRLEFPLLRALCGARGLRQTDWKPSSPDQRAAELLALAATTEDNRHEPSILARAYGDADTIGVRFAQIFRSAFVLNFLLAAFTVIVAVTSLLFDHEIKYWFVIAELLMIGIVLVNTMIGRSWAWHRRWFEAREIAERLRIAVPLWMLGSRPSSFSGQEPAWTGWYVRAVCREQGPRSASLDQKNLSAARATLLGVLDNQCTYHGANSALMEKLESRLETFGLVLFGAAALTAAIFLASVPFADVTDMEAIVITVLASGLPALATASYGIRVIGDFDGSVRRSERTQEALKRVMDAVAEDPLTLQRMRTRARAGAEAMLGDVSGWRIAAESRGLNIPG